MKWDMVAFRFTRLGDDIDSILFEYMPNDEEGSDPNNLWRRYFRFTGPQEPHAELLAVLREDGWEPFAIERGQGTSTSEDVEWTDRWFKRPAEPALPPVPEDWNPNRDL